MQLLQLKFMTGFIIKHFYYRFNQGSQECILIVYVTYWVYHYVNIFNINKTTTFQMFSFSWTGITTSTTHWEKPTPTQKPIPNTSPFVGGLNTGSFKYWPFKIYLNEQWQVSYLAGNFIKAKIRWLCEPATQLLAIYPGEMSTYVHQRTHVMFM